MSKIGKVELINLIGKEAYKKMLYNIKHPEKSKRHKRPKKK